MLQLSIGPEGGPAYEIPFDDLVSVTLDRVPSIVNSKNVQRLSAKEWRHQATSWYDREHAELTRIRRDQPHLSQLVDELRVLIYGVFVREAVAREHPRRVQLSSVRRYKQAYLSFLEAHRTRPILYPICKALPPPQGHYQYLEALHPWSYREFREGLSNSNVLPWRAPD